jgi:hypothetical protein
MEKIKPDLVIVYDKYTEKMANGISGKLAGTYTCLVQSDKVFESNKNSYTNNNRILFLAEDLIQQYLGMGVVTEYAIEKWWEKEKYTVYSCLYSLGNWRGILIYEKSRSILDVIGDTVAYPFIGKRVCKVDIMRFYSENVVEFFCKNENIKLIIPD